MKRLDLSVDVTDASGLGEQATIKVTVHLPTAELLASPPIVCFAKPGAGFSRGYFTTDLPGPASGAQADWHAARGWIFVSVDHLGVGGSSSHEADHLDYTTLSAASDAAEREVLRQLAEGTLHDDTAAIDVPIVLGIGQSMGGCLTIVQQAHHHTYHGIGILGFSVLHTQSPMPPGQAPIVRPWRSRDASVTLNASQLATSPASASIEATRWAYFHDDVDTEFFLPSHEYAARGRELPPWASATYPGVVATILTPGVVASEAAAVDVPVLVVMGDRDVVADPKGEPRAYLSATSVDLFVCPRMAHMHNFAGSRQLVWQRIHAWGSWVAALQGTLDHRAPIPTKENT
ncbi:MAG: hypothetical protein JWN39_4347 [Ilumatobacteraceae bacterium]|nr:hypothetical protein [Ilumatobacteraceae bacterium]